MKKLFTLLCLFLLGAGVASAGEIHKISFNGANAFFVNGESVTGPDIFSWNSEKHSFNSKFNGATYDGITYSSGLKMEGATNVSFTSTAKANVTIVQSDWESKNVEHGTPQTIKFDGGELSLSSATKGTHYYEYTITDVAAGTHSLTRGSGESGVFCVIVEYLETAKEKLASPEVSYDSSTGVVKIGTVSNAEEYYYTTDGQTPSPGIAADTYLYEGPFTVEDGTTVKAVAVDADDVYAISDPTEVIVLLDLSSIDAPTINVLNGTFFATSDVPYANVEYSLDRSSWKRMTRAITLDADATVYARASRGGVTSDIASENVTVIPKPAGTTTVVLSYNEGEAVGKVWTNDDGYKLVINTDEDKSWSAGNRSVTLPNGEFSTFKVSNGAQNVLTVPEGVAVKRMTLYSYINVASSNRVNAWKEVNGDEYVPSFLPMGGYSTVDEPDVRVYEVNTTGDISFTNTGDQLMFLLVLDVTGATTRPPMEPTLYDFTQPLTDADIAALEADEKWQLSEDGKSWALNGTLYERNVSGPLVANDHVISLTDGLLFGRNNSEGLAKGVVYEMKHDLNLVNSAIYFSIPETAEGDIIRIRFASKDENEQGFDITNVDVASISTSEQKDFEMKVLSDRATVFTSTGGTKILQLAINKELPAVEGGAATAISEVKAEQTDGAAYNLAGQRVSDSYKGVMIRNGKKIVVK